MNNNSTNPPNVRPSQPNLFSTNSKFTQPIPPQSSINTPPKSFQNLFGPTDNTNANMQSKPQPLFGPTNINTNANMQSKPQTLFPTNTNTYANIQQPLFGNSYNSNVSRSRSNVPSGFTNIFSSPMEIQHGPFNDDQPTIQQKVKQVTEPSSITIELKARQKVIPLNQDLLIPSMCTIKARGGNRTNVDLICVIDVSGSMTGKKISLVKQTLITLLDQLGQNDRLCLIKFTTVGERLCTLLRNTKQNRLKFQKCIGSLQAGGGDIIMKGVDLAFKMIKERKYQNTVTSIFVLSDGQDQTALEGFRASLQTNTDIFSVHTFGFGDDHDPKLMTEFAKMKDGSFYYIQELSTLDEAFVNALGGLFSVVAQKLKITIQRCTKGKYSDIRIKKTYGSMWKNNEDVYTIELGQVISGVNKDFVFEIEIPALNIEVGDNERNQNIVEAYFEAYDTHNNKTSGKAVLSFTFLNESQKLLEIDEDAGVIQNYLRVKAAEVIETNMKKAQNKQYKEAKGSIEMMVQEIQKNTKVSQQKMTPLVQDLMKLSGNCVQQKFEQVGKNMFTSVGYQHMAQNNFNYSNAQQAQMFGNLQAQKQSKNNNLFGK